MRYMMIVHTDENAAKYGSPPAALMEAMDKVGREAFASGKMVSMGGLRHSSTGARVRLKSGQLHTTDGPFAESKEVVGGFAIMELPTREAAIDEAEKFMDLHRTHWPEWEGVCEVRLMDGGAGQA